MTATPDAADQPTVIIGGKPYELRKLNFKGLKRCWKHVKPVMDMHNAQRGEEDPQKRVELMLSSFDAVIGIIEAGLMRTHPEMTADRIEEELEADEFEAFAGAVIPLMKISNLIKTVGEKKPSGTNEANPSTATGTASSASSSPAAVREEVGNE